MTKRADWGRFIVGGRSDDDLKGTPGRDVIVGGKGADVLEGGAGNDILVGDGFHWKWNHCFWSKPGGSHNDYLDGGAGSDLVLAGRGDDVANYTLSENSRAHDVYDGGKGFDTLQLTLTRAELQLASVQQDIAAFEAFLARKANPYSDHGRTFEFKSFDLDVRNFEALEIRLVGDDTPPANTAPVARNDSFNLQEDAALIVAGPGVAGNDADAEGTSLSAALVAGPVHGTLALGADGSFTYTPDAGFNGSDSFTYRVNDGELDSNVATVALQVAPVNDAPVAAGEAFTTEEDTPLTGNVLANDADADGDALTAELVEDPAFGTLAFNADGTFTYSPNANFNGMDSFTYRATDGSLDSGDVSVDLTVAEINDVPVAADDTFVTLEDSPISGNVTGNDADADGDALTALLLSGPSHGALEFAADGSYTYTPAANFNGTDTFTYQVRDGQAGSNVATATIAVAAVNDTPVAAGEAFATDEDMPLAGNVLANDSDVDGDALTAHLVDSPEFGALVLNADGTFTYTPNADFNGTDSFTYQVRDGQAGSNVATATLAVAPVNDAPVAVGEAFATDEDMPLTGGVLANDADVDGDALTAELVDGPAFGTLAFNADGTFTYTPNANFNGTDSFSYRVSDGSLDSGLTSVDLAVAPADDAPVAADDVFVALEDGPISSSVIGNDADADGEALTASLLSGPSHGALDFAADGSFIYTPAPDFNGIDSFTYQASDGNSGSNAATVTLALAPVNDAPVAGDDVLPEHAYPGVMRVAVIGASQSGYVAAAAQLDDSTAFTMDADAINVRAFVGTPTPFGTQQQWTDLLAGYDAVVLGDNGTGMDYNSSGTLFSALREFVDAGGGVVTAGWFAFDLQTLSGPSRTNADYITPITTQTYQYARTGTAVTILDSTHPITDGVTSYRVNPTAHELAGGVDAGATVLARGVTGVNGSGASLPALVVADVGQGHTAYFGSLQMASAGYSPERAAGSTVDALFERAVAWAAGAQDVFAATDEDTPLAIPAASLLANDSDIDNDSLAIGAVSATSTLGAAVSIGAGGVILYDPSAALQHLSAGNVVADSFDYTILDGNGGTSIGTVNLTVAGRADSDPLV